MLAVDLLLQRDESVHQRLRTRRAAGNMHVHGNIAINSLQHVVTLLEWPAGDGARAHRDHIPGLGHLVVEAHHLRRHLLGHRAGDDHQVGLARRRPEDLGPEARQIVAGHGGGNHLDGAAGQPELHGPDGAAPPPVVQLLDGGNEDALLAQFDLQPCLHSHRRLQFQGISSARAGVRDQGSETGPHSLPFYGAATTAMEPAAVVEVIWESSWPVVAASKV